MKSITIVLDESRLRRSRMGSRREFLTVAAAFAAGSAGTASAAQVVTLLNGDGAPVKRLGTIGDFYIDDRTHAIYGPKRKSGWGSPTSLLGPSGASGLSGTGDAGAPGPEGPQGPAGFSVLHGVGPPSANLGEDNDFYIDTASTQIYGPRDEGVWGSPVALTGAGSITMIDGGSL